MEAPTTENILQFHVAFVFFSVWVERERECFFHALRAFWHHEYLPKTSTIFEIAVKRVGQEENVVDRFPKRKAIEP
jgi:hypothetical protein